MSENGQKKAKVEVRRLEEAPPGLGVPAGWMPEIIYHFTATDIPNKADFTMLLMPREKSFLIRRLAVKPEDSGAWDIKVQVGPMTVLTRTPASELSEDNKVKEWPGALSPRLVKLGQQIRITLYQREPSAPSDRFECILRGAGAVSK